MPEMTWDDGGSEGAPPPPTSGAETLQRYLSALNRFKWLILLCVLVGAGAGIVATRFVTPLYETQATIIVAPASSNSDRATIANLQRSGYLELLAAFNVLDPVVTRLKLYLSPREAADTLFFRDFEIDQTVVPGQYMLRAVGTGYELSTVDPSRVLETGARGDSVGRSVGFRWTPDTALLLRRREVQFVVQTPREASVQLQGRMQPRLIEGSNLLRMTLTGTNAALTALTLNTWADRFVEVATDFKRFQESQRAGMLDGQLEYAANELAAAERSLEDFRVRTATLPSESHIPQLAGMQLGQDPVFSAYATNRSEAESLRRDKEAIRRALVSGPSGSVSAEALYSVPTIATGAAGVQLRGQLDELIRREANLRGLRQRLTEEHREVVLEREAVELLRTRDIPLSVEAIVATIDDRTRDLDERTSASAADLQGMPTRAIELGRLTRQVEVQDERYRSLLAAAQAARLAEQTTPPDIAVFDRAVPPLRPTRNQAPVIIAGAILAALGLGIALAILLDLLDKRFRYPQQATNDLGLFILGVVPIFGRSKRRSTEEQVQMIEAFRAVRMNMRYAVDPSRPLTVAVTSPGPSDGKSFVSANLALSFADGGARVLLIDGDVRRGRQHATFAIEQKPGLVEYLEGTALLPETLRDTTHDNLTVLPCGKRLRKAPELLNGPRLTQLIAQFAREYDVVIVDSPPLGAGADAYSLGIASTNLVLVLRSGLSDRKMAAAKLQIVDSLPIRVLGTVLNGIKLSGVYQYYSYYLDYASDDETPKALEGGSRERSALVRSRVE